MCEIVHVCHAAISQLTGRRGAASLRCLLFSQEEAAAPGGSLCTEIRHQSGHSLPGPTEKERRKSEEFIREQIYSERFFRGSRYIQLRATQTIINVLLDETGPTVRREKIKNNLDRLSATLGDKQTRRCRHQWQAHLVCKYTRGEVDGMRCCTEARIWLVASREGLEKHREKQRNLKDPAAFYSVKCQRKEWYMMMTRRYNYSPFIWARIMKVKAGSRGETNSCMDYDYSNASCGTHRCHTGVTRFLYEPCGPLYVPFSKSECVFFHIFYHPLCLWAAD